MKYSPLDAQHRALGAKMVPFAGWEMPMSYATGTLAEHRRCRADAVVFDVSHLGTVRVQGVGAFAALQPTFTNDLSKISPGRAQYTHLLDPSDASVTDDIIVWWREHDLFDVMPNASNTDRVVQAIMQSSAALANDANDIEVADVTAERSVLAVQGPFSRAKLIALGDFRSVARFRLSPLEVAGVDCVVAGTGYTGELGFEIAVPAHRSVEVWNAILGCEIGAAGLGARDTLRLEAALPLHGHELGAGITPLQAGLAWVVSFSKGPFIGRDALYAEREKGVERTLTGIRFDGRQAGREGDIVENAEGRTIGAITSGNFSPSLECGIALAYLNPTLSIGDRVSAVVRGRSVEGRICMLPFYTRPS